MENKETSYKRIGRLIYIKTPSFEELDFTTKLWADYDTMRDVGGPIIFEDSRKKDWYNRMISGKGGNDFYRLIYKLNDESVGEVSFI